MAGDWIKMRIDLQSHPKIVRILSATGADKFRVIGGLHAVWSVFDLHSENGILKGYTPELMDHIIGWDGFSRAMESVGWLVFDGIETLEMPEFTEHNGKSAKRRAEDQKRKKEARKTSEECPDDCGQNADKMRTREEKRRKEIKPPKSPKGEFELPDWVPGDLWKDYLETRRVMKSPMTDRAKQLALKELEKLRDAGHQPHSVLSQSIYNGWKGLFPVKNPDKTADPFAGAINA